MPELAIWPAWQRHDPAIERDAELFWHKEQVLPKSADVGARLAGVCAVAYSGNRLIGVTSARIRQINFLRCKLAMLRCVVARGPKQRDTGYQLTAYSRDLLEEWARNNPAEDVRGVGTVVQSRRLAAAWRSAYCPRTKLALVGYTAQGYPMRVYWFAHARISREYAGDPAGQ